MYLCSDRMTGILTTTTMTLPVTVSAIHWFVCVVCGVYAADHIRDSGSANTGTIKSYQGSEARYSQTLPNPSRSSGRAITGSAVSA